MVVERLAHHEPEFDFVVEGNAAGPDAWLGAGDDAGGRFEEEEGLDWTGGGELIYVVAKGECC